MRILLTRPAPGSDPQWEQLLVGHGHEVLRCVCDLTDPTSVARDDCPIWIADAVVDARGAATDPVTGYERGARCGLAQGLPVVVIGDGVPGELAGAVACSPDRAWDGAPGPIDDLEDELRVVAQAAAAHRGDRFQVRAVSISGHEVHVGLSVTPDHGDEEAIADAVRAHLVARGHPVHALGVVVQRQA